MGTADIVKEHMKRQWSDKVIPGRKVRIKVNKDLCPAVVEECHYVSKISSDYLYCKKKVNKKKYIYIYKKVNSVTQSHVTVPSEQKKTFKVINVM